MTASRPVTASRDAYAELLDVLREVDERFCGEEWLVTEPDLPDAYRNVFHILQSALYSHFEFDPERPVFHRIVSPTRKFTGDNADAVYFEAPIRGDRAYRITGNLAGAVYTSFTIEAGAEEGRYATRTCGVVNDTEIDIDADGSYELVLGGEPRDRNWLALEPDAGRITTRHYFEWPQPAAAMQDLHIPLTIENLTPPAEPPARWTDADSAAAIRRVVNHVRGKTIDQPVPGSVAQPDFVSTEPNVFPKPVVPGNLAFAAFDAAYSMTRYQLGPDEALVIRGRWPECTFANVCLWTRFGQTYDYSNRSICLNRSNTTLDDDGGFTMVVAHHDPGVSNWLDTEGRPYGSIFWRYFLPTGDIATPEATVVPFDSL